MNIDKIYICADCNHEIKGHHFILGVSSRGSPDRFICFSCSEIRIDKYRTHLAERELIEADLDNLPRVNEDWEEHG